MTIFCACAKFNKSLRASNQFTWKDVTVTNFYENSVFDREFFSELTKSPILHFLFIWSLFETRPMIRIFPKLTGKRFGSSGRFRAKRLLANELGRSQQECVTFWSSYRCNSIDSLSEIKYVGLRWKNIKLEVYNRIQSLNSAPKSVFILRVAKTIV